MSSLREIEMFSQPSYDNFASLVSLLLNNINHPEESDEGPQESVAEIYKDEIGLKALSVESDVDHGLMPKVLHTVKLLLVNLVFI